jgi:hypothetical protein
VIRVRSYWHKEKQRTGPELLGSVYKVDNSQFILHCELAGNLGTETFCWGTSRLRTEIGPNMGSSREKPAEGPNRRRPKVTGRFARGLYSTLNMLRSLLPVHLHLQFYVDAVDSIVTYPTDCNLTCHLTNWG